MADSKTLLFIHDEKAEILEDYILREQPVRAANDVHFAVGDFLQSYLDFFGTSKAAEHFNTNGERRKPALERFEMLESQHRGGRKHSHLLAIAQSFEGGAHGHFGLAVADVAAEQPIHGMLTLHVSFDLCDGR